MPWLRLIRWKNLLIIFLTQLLAWWCLIVPASPVVLSLVNFILLSLSTLLIAAAGYIINDYFDIKIDLINRPEKMVLEKNIPRKQAIISHTVLNFIALLLAGYVALRGGHIEWLLVQVFCTLLLWFYSTHFKRQYVTGNIAVSLLTALSVLTLFIYEPAVRMPAEGKFLPAPGWELIIYTFFAFMLTWMREIVKDMEDHIGDEAEGCVTMPVRKGLRYATNFTIVLSVLVVAFLSYASYFLYHFGFRILSGFTVVLVLSLVGWSVFFFRGKAATPHYRIASRGLKIIMLLGIISLLIYHYQITASCLTIR